MYGTLQCTHPPAAHGVEEELCGCEPRVEAVLHKTLGGWDPAAKLIKI